MRELVRLRGTESELLEILSKLRAIAGSTEVARLSREKLNGLTALHVAGGSATAGGWFSDVLADAAKPETVKDSPLRLQTSRKELSRKEQWADRAESAKEGRSAEVLEIYIILVRLQMPSQKK